MGKIISLVLISDNSSRFLEGPLSLNFYMLFYFYLLLLYFYFCSFTFQFPEILISDKGIATGFLFTCQSQMQHTYRRLVTHLEIEMSTL